MPEDHQNEKEDLALNCRLTRMKNHCKHLITGLDVEVIQVKQEEC